MIKLYDWQIAALEKWKLNNYRGVISATTGSGKTMVGIEAIRTLNHKDNSLKIIILVPTVALLNQWKYVLCEENIYNDADIGLSGGKYSDKLRNKKLMIYVANSALKYLNDEIDEISSNSNLFLIADECHRYGASKLSLLLKNKYKYTIGISATPERENDYGFEDYIEPYLGKIIYKYDFESAINDGVISPFRIENYGITLSGNDKEEYRKLSEKITDLLNLLKKRHPSIIFKKDRFIAELRKYESSDPDVKIFRDISNARKRLLYRCNLRLDCVLDLVEKYKSHKVMIFHEDVDSLNNIYKTLTNAGHVCAIIHYKNRKGSFEEFKRNDVRIFISAKMFSEGVDVPDVDVGIIAASNSSIRQKIQTMGRIVRKTKDKELAIIINIFIKDTTDESVFWKINWEEIIGKDRMDFISWPEKEEIEIRKIKHKRFRSEEEEDIRIKENILLNGEEYTAPVGGEKYSFDTSWKLFRKKARKKDYAINQGEIIDLIDMVKHIKPEAGSFYVNDKGHVIVKSKDYVPHYVGIFNKKILFK